MFIMETTNNVSENINPTKSKWNLKKLLVLAGVFLVVGSLAFGVWGIIKLTSLENKQDSSLKDKETSNFPTETVRDATSSSSKKPIVSITYDSHSLLTQIAGNIG